MTIVLRFLPGPEPTGDSRLYDNPTLLGQAKTTKARTRGTRSGARCAGSSVLPKEKRGRRGGREADENDPSLANMGQRLITSPENLN